MSPWHPYWTEPLAVPAEARARSFPCPGYAWSIQALFRGVFYRHGDARIMPEPTKKAVEMLLKGATLASEPCPYCKGVRVMRDGYALCVGCGREPSGDVPHAPSADPQNDRGGMPVGILEEKLRSLGSELAEESDHAKQQEILRSINMLVDTIDKMKGRAGRDGP
ncbi:hypothetical protein CENSYa_1209 [Cenarchaeum symbiosum A]|uniref:Sjogrens syndrome scleroderma autoantigen 1 n=1 Tax=Cenarchaeum symbiosum (strain A) TaxID=414004 RepID=A0RWW6_CENSY|nr:hypothetical protein CENSYa_1209 [Cenarchaeum symbiosum A]